MKTDVSRLTIPTGQEARATLVPRHVIDPLAAADTFDPVRIERHLSHAQGYLALGMLAEAAAELERIPAPSNELLTVVAVRLAVLQEQRSWPELAKLAATLVMRAPEDAGAWITWAYATRRSRSLAEAEGILLAAEERHSQVATIQFNLGCYACQRGDLVAARARVDRAIALDANFAASAATDPDLARLRGEPPGSQPPPAD
jgi:tetratricopeptide (TPR) repeat protein